MWKYVGNMKKYVGNMKKYGENMKEYVENLKHEENMKECDGTSGNYMDGVGGRVYECEQCIIA